MINAENLLPFEALEELHAFSLQIADETKGLIRELWENGSFVESLKEDNTPVTVIDLEAEDLFRNLILSKFPEHGIAGEEYEPVNPESDFQWTIDPIDGTQNLVNCIPTFGTLIGLRFKGEAVLGVIDHPVMGIRVSGGKGLGVFHNGMKVTLADLVEEKLSPTDLIVTNTPAVFARTEEDNRLFQRVMSFHPHSRIYYDCYGHTLAVLGAVAVVVEPNLKIWDITPVEALIAEAGGRCVKFNVTNDPVWMCDAVFGKQKAVRLMCSHLGACVTGC